MLFYPLRLSFGDGMCAKCPILHYAVKSVSFHKLGGVSLHSKNGKKTTAFVFFLLLRTTVGTL